MHTAQLLLNVVPFMLVIMGDGLRITRPIFYHKPYDELSKSRSCFASDKQEEDEEVPDLLSGGVELVRFGGPVDPPNSAQRQLLSDTIGLLPVRHLALIARVEARRPGQAPVNGGGNNARDRVVRLSANSFASQSDVNLTFLHEMGHLVDIGFDCSRQVQQLARMPGPLQRDAQALLDTPHIGATHGAGERIADCYMVLMRSLRTTRPYTSRSCPTQYQGAEAQRRFRVLLSTTAFTNITMEQLIAATDEASFNRLIAGLR